MNKSLADQKPLDDGALSISGDITGAPDDPDDSRPLIVIRPSNSIFSIGLGDLWAYRELLYFLTLRDVKIRYKQTVIGVAWVILQPVTGMVLFSVVFGRLVKIDTGNIPYPLFALCGLAIWTYVQTTITSSSNSLVNNTNLITKIYFPRLIIPIASAGAGLVDLFLNMIVLSLFMLYYSSGLYLQMLLAPLFLIQLLLTSIAIGTLLSALNARYRDVKQILPFALQLWMFASPVLYPLNIFPEKWRWVLALNPLTGILEGFRASLFGGSYDLTTIGASVVVTISLLLISLIVFQKMERDFADYI